MSIKEDIHQDRRLPTVEEGEYEGAFCIGECDGVDVYWYPPQNVLVHQDSQSEYVVCKKLSRQTVGEYISQSGTEGGLWDLNALGKFFRSTSDFEGVRILTVQQEEAYGLYRIAGANKARVSELLGISESCVDERLSIAQKKISCSFNLLDSILMIR